MHPLESTMAQILERGEPPTLAAFGGASPLLAAAIPLGQCPLMPEFFRLSVASLAEADQSAHDLKEFACVCLDQASIDFILVELIGIIEAAGPLPADLADRAFEKFLALAADRNAQPMSRAAALDGTLRASMASRPRQLRLLAMLLSINVNDSPLFLGRAARILGVAYAHWPEAGLLQRLSELSEVAGVGDEACFELGMACVLKGINTSSRREAETEFGAARHWFQKSIDIRPHRPIASAYLLCIDALIAFSRGEAVDAAAPLVSALGEVAFQLRAWQFSDCDPPWLGARNAEVSCWNLLALTMKKLADSLGEVSWWEPAVVIEQHVIAAYIASRSILKRSQDGGVEALVRPRIEGTLASQRGQAYALASWLARNSAHEWAPAAKALSNRVTELLGGNDHPPGKSRKRLQSRHRF